jgi:hypothetical protein
VLTRRAAITVGVSAFMLFVALRYSSYVQHQLQDEKRKNPPHRPSPLEDLGDDNGRNNNNRNNGGGNGNGGGGNGHGHGHGNRNGGHNGNGEAMVGQLGGELLATEGVSLG